MKFLRAASVLWGLYLIFQAYTLYSAYSSGIDGSGMGVYLLEFIEINDTVMVEEIPVYIKSFAFIGITLIILPIITKLFSKAQSA